MFTLLFSDNEREWWQERSSSTINKKFHKSTITVAHLASDCDIILSFEDKNHLNYYLLITHK